MKTRIAPTSPSLKSPVIPGCGGRRSRRGFTFTEVLFAVMILGIGFIMIAGVFPVAISQTASSQEETVGAGIARSAMGAYASVPYLSQFVLNNGQVTRLTDDNFTVTTSSGNVVVKPWSLVKGNQILADEPRFGWVAMLKREITDPRGQPPSTAQLIVVPVQIRGESQFSPSPDLNQTGSGATAESPLLPYPIQVTLTEKVADPDECAITGTFVEAAAPGAVVVTSGGKVYRLGQLKSGNTYELLPGNDMSGTSENFTGSAFIVGRRKTGGSFQGSSIAIGAYVTYIPLR